MNDLDDPLALISFLIIRSSPKSRSISFNFSLIILLDLNNPSIIDFLFLSSNKSTEDLAPKSKLIAPTITDFPAPVSPVIIVKPFLKSTDKFSISA